MAEVSRWLEYHQKSTDSNSEMLKKMNISDKLNNQLHITFTQDNGIKLQALVSEIERKIDHLVTQIYQAIKTAADLSSNWNKEDEIQLADNMLYI